MLCFLAFWVLFCVGCVAVSYSEAVALRDHGIRTPAVVTAVQDGRDSYVTVRFMTRAGTTVTADVGHYEWQPEPRVGDGPTVVYDPDDPAGNVADVRMGPDFLSPWLFAAGAVAAAGAFLGTWTDLIDWGRAARERYGVG
jgi:hypothetical protein